jgi:hypothetical protein
MTRTKTEYRAKVRRKRPYAYALSAIGDKEKGWGGYPFGEASIYSPFGGKTLCLCQRVREAAK